jgi:hypothetical protein
MSELGVFLSKKSIKKANLWFKPFLFDSKLNEWNKNKSYKLETEKLFISALAIDIEPNEILKIIYGHLKLKKEK